MRGHIGPADSDGAEFVLADVAVDDFLLARRRVEMPLPIRFHQWNRHRPVVRANFKSDFIVALFHLITALRHDDGEPLRIVRVLHLGRRLKALEFRAENFVQARHIFCFGGRLQGFDGVIRRCEQPLRDHWFRLRFIGSAA